MIPLPLPLPFLVLLLLPLAVPLLTMAVPFATLFAINLLPLLLVELLLKPTAAAVAAILRAVAWTVALSDWGLEGPRLLIACSRVPHPLVVFVGASGGKGFLPSGGLDWK